MNKKETKVKTVQMLRKLSRVCSVIALSITALDLAGPPWSFFFANQPPIPDKYKGKYSKKE